MDHYPTELTQPDEERLEIRWSDGQLRKYSVHDLRDACPCATCREKRDAPPPPAAMLPVISVEQAQPLRITGMQPVGNYAYAIAFTDGHDTGIYDFALLRALGEED
ncbi:MAG: DUF971 domain-containing protein [Pirellulaceae bacterium]